MIRPTGSLTSELDRSALLAERDWSAKARAYIENAGDDILINEFVLEHQKRVLAFCEWFVEAVVRRTKEALDEFETRQAEVATAWKDAWGPPVEDRADRPYLG